MWQPRVMQANGNIYPSRFVKLDGSVNNAVLQAGANDVIFGVSQEGTRTAPIPDASAYAAIQYENVRVYTAMQTCRLQLGATVTTERRLKSDADGKGTPVVGGTNSHENWGAMAVEAGSANEFAEVLVVGPMTVSHAGSSSGFVPS